MNATKQSNKMHLSVIIVALDLLAGAMQIVILNTQGKESRIVTEKRLGSSFAKASSRFLENTTEQRREETGPTQNKTNVIYSESKQETKTSLELDECHDTCCIRMSHREPKPYRPDAADATATPSIADRIGIFEERQYLAEVYFGNLPRPEEFRGVTLTESLLPCLQPGTVIFVDLKYLPQFFKEMHPKIRVPYVLFSTDSDRAAPGNMLRYLRDPNSMILHWYSTNCNKLDTKIPKFTCMPLGLSQWDAKHHMRPGLENFLTSIEPRVIYQKGRPIFPKTIEEKRDKLALLSFNNNTNPDRRSVWSYMCDGPLWQSWRDRGQVQCGYQKLTNTIQPFYETAVRYKFMVSPHGVGLDCFRTWEALFLGMIPIVKSSTLDPLYRDLPVVIVKQWSDVTPELLENAWEEFQHKEFDFSTLYISHWQQELWQFRESPSVKFEYSSLVPESDNKQQKRAKKNKNASKKDRIKSIA